MSKNKQPEHQSFPGLKKNIAHSKFEENIESFNLRGYFIAENIFSEKEVKFFKQKMKLLWTKQVDKYGEKLLKKIGDYGVLRAMMEEDRTFLDLIIDERIFQFVRFILGDSAILHLQNGIILFPSISHNQARYHKDFPKNFIPSKTLSINTFILIDDFNQENGGTWVLPGSHKYTELPSDQFIKQNEIQINAKSGSVLIFDSMLWHKGGWNKTKKERAGINQQYTKPFIKQQLDYPVILKDKVEKESKIAQTLGIWTIPPKSVDEYRVTDPKLRTYRGGQG